MAEAVYETLEGCCEVTALQAVYETHMEDIDGHMKSITDYISFCDFTVLAETDHCYPNNKPKVTNNINAILNAKKRAFRANNREEVRIYRGKWKSKSGRFKRGTEGSWSVNSRRRTWEKSSGVRAITCFRSTSSRGVEGSVDPVNELSLFIIRFYTVAKLLLLRHSGKAAGPDGIIPRILEVWAHQECGVLQQVLALTFNILKPLERLVLEQLQPIVKPFLDSLQFAYQPGLGVEDAITYLFMPWQAQEHFSLLQCRPPLEVFWWFHISWMYQQGSTFSTRLIPPRCTTQRHRGSFLPVAKLHTSLLWLSETQWTEFPLTIYCTC